MDVSIVIPVYNSEPYLTELVARLDQVLRSAVREYEVILINVASRDRSWAIISRLAKVHSWLRGIDLLWNYSQHNALLAGIRAAKSEVIVTMDDDLQHPPEEIPTLLSKLEAGYDLVYGIPRVEMHRRWRIIASHLMRLTHLTLGNGRASRRSSYRAFRASLRESFAEYHSPFVALDPLLARAEPRVATVPVHHDARREGKSNYDLRKLIALAISVITTTSTRPGAQLVC